MINSFSRKDFRLSFIDEQYFVTVSTRTITCKMVYTINCPEGYFVFLGDPDELTYSVVGKATCSKDDQFDENIGKKIARTKAENKAYKQASRFLKKVTDSFTDVLMMAGSFQEKAKGCIQHNERYIQDVMNKIKPAVKKVEYVAPVAPIAETTSDNVKVYTKKTPMGEIKVTEKELTKEEAIAEMKRFNEEFISFMKRFDDFRESFGFGRFF